MPAIFQLQTEDELDRLLEQSANIPVWIFKHSLACGVSSHALKEFERFVATVDPDDPAHFAVVEIQNVPQISRQVTARTGVQHESPQLLFLHRGRVVWEASHWAIRRRTLDRTRAQHQAPSVESG